MKEMSGLPYVPDRWFWRVAESGGKYRLELRVKHRFWPGSTRVSTMNIGRYGLDFEVTEGSILTTAARMIDGLNSRVKVNSFLGNYPPKKLGGGDA